MAQDLSSVLQKALELDPLSRVKLIDALFASIESAEMLQRERTWATVAERRTDLYEKGEHGSEPWDDLKERLRRGE